MLDDDLDKDKLEILDKIKSRMKELFVQLDTLTHYHYTPTPINAEVIFSNFYPFSRHYASETFKM